MGPRGRERKRKRGRGGAKGQKSLFWRRVIRFICPHRSLDISRLAMLVGIACRSLYCCIRHQTASGTAQTLERCRGPVHHMSYAPVSKHDERVHEGKNAITFRLKADETRERKRRWGQLLTQNNRSPSQAYGGGLCNGQ